MNFLKKYVFFLLIIYVKLTETPNQAPNRPLPPPPVDAYPPSKPLPPIPKNNSPDNDDSASDHTLVLRRVSCLHSLE